ncbi:hypothetical protein AMECASPLE_023902 [Ameca splendens]|uniref:Uncharacterized protein n=1 Tax=Ameca splendens TaxID=208324 RepID=A0ABV0YR64_9TELE
MSEIFSKQCIIFQPLNMYALPSAYNMTKIEKVQGVHYKWVEKPVSVSLITSLLLCMFVFLSPAVCKSIQEPVTKQILLEYLDRCVQGVNTQSRKNPSDPDSELMPPPPPKRPNWAAP